VPACRGGITTTADAACANSAMPSNDAERILSRISPLADISDVHALRPAEVVSFAESVS